LTAHRQACVLDRPQRGLDAACGIAVRDEGEQPSEPLGSDDFRGAEPVDLVALRVSPIRKCSVFSEREQPARVGATMLSGRGTQLPGVSGERHATAPRRRVAADIFVALAAKYAVLERAQVHASRSSHHALQRNSATTGSEVQGASSQTRSTPSVARLVELDAPKAPALERREQDTRAVVAAAGERDRLARLQQREHEGCRRAGAGREDQRLAAFELAELSLDGERVGMRIALVVELAGLPVAVRPDRCAFDGLHEGGL
jgi:hypothetical protein